MTVFGRDSLITSYQALPFTPELAKTSLRVLAARQGKKVDPYRDGDGYVEYQRALETGLENQCWKDSWNSILFADGSLAEAPRATCEIQGYVYDGKRRCARLAREVWDDPGLADRLQREAAELKARFNRDFWLADRQFFALALDGDKR